MLGECHVLEMVRESHVLSFDLQVGIVPLAVLLLLYGGSKEYFQVLRGRPFDTLHQFRTLVVRASTRLFISRPPLERKRWTIRLSERDPIIFALFLASKLRLVVVVILAQTFDLG